MGLINQDIKNLVSGVSQQPPILRHPEQLEEQLNGYSSEAGGLQKRPPSILVANLGRKINDSSKPLVHFIDRDVNEKYIVLFTGSDIEVYDMQGNRKTVNFASGTKTYITLQAPRHQIKAITIADYTFICNTNVVARMTNSIDSRVWDKQGLLVNVKSGQYGRTYRVVANGSTIASHETPDGSDKSHTKLIATDYIAEQLAASARSSGYNATAGSSWVYITHGSTKITSAVVYDGYNNQAAFGILNSVQKFAVLPATAPNGFTVKINGEKGSNTDDYYVSYVAEDQVWRECARPSMKNHIDNTTMPHVLVREADGTFTFKCADWAVRDVGDEDSNPKPSFIGGTINDVFYHRNRLGFLSGENVILTRSADFFNFWMTSATKVQDTDPIDLAVSDNTISTLYNAVTFDTDLILFSQEAQFMLSADGILTPTSANLSPAVTHYEASLKAKPVNAGRNVYFVAERAKYTTVREFFTAADNTDAKDVQDITSHVPNYIPNGVYKIIPSTVENVMLYLTEGAETSIYVYKYLFIDSQRVQAAWSKWDMQGVVYGGQFIDNYLYLIVERNGYYCLEKISFTINTTDFDGEAYRILLDCKHSYQIPAECYDSLKDETTVNISDIFGDIYEQDKQYSAVAPDGTYTKSKEGKLVFIGDYSNQVLTVGINYNFKIVMSTIMVKQSDNGSTQALIEGRLQLRQMWFNYADSGYFKVTVDIKDKQAYVYEYTSRLLGTRFNILGAMPFTTGSFKFPIQAKNENVNICLETDTPLPVSLVGAGWIGNYQRRTRLF